MTKDEWKEIERGILELTKEIEEEDFVWKLDLEDVHMNLERALRIKTQAADKLHTGRSRNDQVATDMRLFFKDACDQLKIGIEASMLALLEL